MQSGITLFSDKVTAYTAARPSYPLEMVLYLEEKCSLTKDSHIVEIGSGTGKFTELLLKNGYTVIGCEPCENMRKKAECILEKYSDRFISINGDGEDTTLKDQSTDLIVIANAFHFFDNEYGVKELQRILKPDGRIAIIYNYRNTETSELAAEYETILIKYCPKYASFVSKFGKDSHITNLFSPKESQIFTVNHEHSLTLTQYIERFNSAAWFEPSGLSVEERKLFDSEVKTTYRRCQQHSEIKNMRYHEEEDPIKIGYQTRMYLL